MKVFLSHASEDRELAERVSLSIAQFGHEVLWSKGLPSGQQFDERLRAMVRASDAFVFLASKHSLASKSYCLTELGWASERWENPSGVVLPVLIDDSPIDQIPAYLRAVTVLEPKGNDVAEIAAATDGLEEPKRLAREKRRRRNAIGVAASLTLVSWLIYEGTRTPVLAADFQLSAVEGEFVRTSPWVSLPGVEVRFEDASAGEPEQHEWVFGGTIEGSTEEVTTRRFEQAGTYEVQLRVARDEQESSTTQRIEIVEPVQARIDAPRTRGPAPLSLELFDHSRGEVQSRRWDFGDGRSATSGTAEHTYTEPGSYEVSLHVVGAYGASEDDDSLTVEVLPPALDLLVEPALGPVPLTVVLHDRTDADVAGRRWLVDGKPIEATDAQLEWTFSTPGAHTVDLEAEVLGVPLATKTNIETTEPVVLKEFTPLPFIRAEPNGLRGQVVAAVHIAGAVQGYELQLDGEPWESTINNSIFNAQKAAAEAQGIPPDKLENMFPPGEIIDMHVGFAPWGSHVLTCTVTGRGGDLVSAERQVEVPLKYQVEWTTTLDVGKDSDVRLRLKSFAGMVQLRVTEVRSNGKSQTDKHIFQTPEGYELADFLEEGGLVDASDRHRWKPNQGNLHETLKAKTRVEGSRAKVEVTMKRLYELRPR